MRPGLAKPILASVFWTWLEVGDIHSGDTWEVSQVHPPQSVPAGDLWGLLGVLLQQTARGHCGGRTIGARSGLFQPPQKAQKRVSVLGMEVQGHRGMG